jgi:hypothetical protein
MATARRAQHIMRLVGHVREIRWPVLFYLDPAGLDMVDRLRPLTCLLAESRHDLERVIPSGNMAFSPATLRTSRSK